jgi:hypothetical protein
MLSLSSGGCALVSERSAEHQASGSPSRTNGMLIPPLAAVQLDGRLAAPAGAHVCFGPVATKVAAQQDIAALVPRRKHFVGFPAPFEVGHRPPWPRYAI